MSRLELYGALSGSHYRQHALWIEAANQAETRQRRIETSVAAPASGVKR
jgi:uncharacterized protein YdeI (YjbR/CyaY-like superfamily)